MSALEKQLGFWEFPKEPSEDGKKKEKSRLSARRETSAGTTLQATQLALVGIGLPSSMPVSLPQSKKKTSIVSVNISEVDIRASELVYEVGGGLNYKRQKFLSVLERIMSGSVERVVVAYKDRLARFGFELFDWLCTKNSCELVVLNEVKLSPERELVDDILAILHCFDSELYGLRKYKSEIAKDSDLPKPKSPSNLEKVVSRE